jgi:hypothetical protein
MPGDPRAQAEQNADELRQRIGLGMAPIADLVTVLEMELGVRLRSPNRQSHFRCVRVRRSAQASAPERESSSRGARNRQRTKPGISVHVSQRFCMRSKTTREMVCRRVRAAAHSHAVCSEVPRGDCRSNRLTTTRHCSRPLWSVAGGDGTAPGRARVYETGNVGLVSGQWRNHRRRRTPSARRPRVPTAQPTQTE